MNATELLNRIKEQYPEGKPAVFNYAEARRMLIALAGRIVILEAQLNNDNGGNAQ